MRLRLQLAEAIVHAAVVHAEDLGIQVSVAACREDGRIVAFLKMDGTNVISDTMGRMVGSRHA